MPYLFIIFGIWAIIGALYNWKEYIKDGMPKVISDAIGATSMRILYVVIGLILISLAFYLKQEWLTYIIK